MITMLVFVAVGIVIGWNWPQPPWARDLQRKVLDAVRSGTGKIGQ